MDRRQQSQLQRPYNWRRVEKSRWGLSWTGLFVLLVGIIILGAIGAVVYGEYEIHTPQNAQVSRFPFRVRNGDTYNTIASRLRDRGILHNTLLFSLDARIQGLGSKLLVGTYTLRPNMSIDEMISTLGSGHPRLVTVTIPPGWRAEQMAELLNANGISGHDFLHAVRKHHFPLGFKAGVPQGQTVDGFLYPDTYTVAPGYPGGAFAQLMIRRFGHIFGPRMRAAANHRNMSIYRVTNVAAIIERESRFGPDRSKVASVIYNRLHNGMPLQSDVTVQYALGNKENWWPPPPTSSIINTVHSRYNTYLHSGLPPGPIDDPGKPSLYAALHPAHTSYLYWFAKRNGHLLFERTLAQHNADVARYG